MKDNTIRQVGYSSFFQTLEIHMNHSTPGLSKDGCFAEYMVLNTENLHVIDDELPTETDVYTEPLAAAFEILEQIIIEKGMPVGVLGDGRLALVLVRKKGTIVLKSTAY